MKHFSLKIQHPLRVFLSIWGISAFLAACPAAARDYLTGEALKALIEGRTIYYTKDGQPYGAEQYFPGNRVIWAIEGGHCSRGSWYSVGTLICFEYDTGNPASCWRFFQKAGRLFVVPDGREDDVPLEASRIETEPLQCVPPGLGA